MVVEITSSSQGIMVVEHDDRPAGTKTPELCARCREAAVDVDGFCGLCGAVTLAESRYVADDVAAA